MATIVDVFAGSGYVNGDNNLMNIPLSPEEEGVEPRYKVRLIGEEFKRLVFNVKDL